jgi:hypothetical protein
MRGHLDRVRSFADADPCRSGAGRIVSFVIADALDHLLAQQLADEDGAAVVPGLLPGMSEAEIADAEGALGVSERR